MNLPKLHTWPKPWRSLIAVFTSTVFIGFVSAVTFLEILTHLSPSGVISEYNGTPQAQMDTAVEMQFPKSVHNMLITTHNHVLGLSALSLILGFLYLQTGESSPWRTSIASEPLLSLLFTFGSIWLMRFVSSDFVILVILSGTLMVLCTIWMCYRILLSCVQGSDYQPWLKKI